MEIVEIVKCKYRQNLISEARSLTKFKKIGYEIIVAGIGATI